MLGEWNTYAVRHACETQIYFVSVRRSPEQSDRHAIVSLASRDDAGPIRSTIREGPMPVQWTAHIPQEMQRHGGSIKPEAEPECDEAMSRFLQRLRQQETPRQPDNRADAPSQH